VVARETCSGRTKIKQLKDRNVLLGCIEPHLTHLAERQDKANSTVVLEHT